MKVTATELKNNLGKYLKIAANEDVIITRNGKKVAHLYRHDPDDKKRFSIREGSAAYSSLEPVKATYDEFLRLVENSVNRYEYINGVIYLLASPTHNHQLISTNILQAFFQWFKDKKCKPFHAPYDIRIKIDEDINIVQPDILVICDDDKVDEKGKYQGIPSLVVEILSPSSKSRDMIQKLELYMSGGVEEYWIVDIEKSEIYVYTFECRELKNMSIYRKNDSVESMLYDGLNIDMNEIFKSDNYS